MHEPPPRRRTFPGDDEISRLLRTTDWSRTSLGPREQWSDVLTGYVRMIHALPTAAIIFWGPDQVQLYNSGYAVIMGPRHPKFFGRTYKECWPDTYPTIYPWMRRVLDEGEVLQVENEHIPLTRYGFDEEAYFSFTFSPVHDEHGNIQGIFQPVFEVTQNVLGQRRAETLRALESPSNVSGDIQAAVNTLASNDKDIPLAMFYLASEVTGALELSATSPGMTADEAPFGELASEVFRTGVTRTVTDAQDMFGGAHVGPWPEPTRAVFCLPIRPPGDETHRGVALFGLSPRLHFDANYRAFLERRSNQVIGQMALEQERAARRAEAENQRRYLQDLFMQAPVAIAVLRGPDLTFELVNPRYRQLIGQRRDVLGLPVRTALPELTKQPFIGILDQVYRLGEPYVGLGVTVALDRSREGSAEKLFCDVVYQPMRDAAGVVEGILVFAYDVTEQALSRRHAERLTAELKAEHARKDEFLAMLAHELRNPLAAIHNAVELSELSAEGPNITPGRTLQILKRQTQNLTTMVNDLLDVSRVTRGQIALFRETLDLRQVLQMTFESTRASFERKHQRVRLELPETSVKVEGDAVRLDQVLSNLMVNAAKYTDEGGEIVMSLRTEGDSAFFSVRDDGIGLEAGAIDEIFVLFGQVERTADRAQGGLGIGLTVAKSVVELHGGSISASSEGLGKGSEFVVRLPLTSSDEPRDRKASTSQPPPPKRILLVDDNLDAAETLALLLEVSGHEIQTAGSSEEALALAAERDFDAIFLDIGLPVLDGYAVVQRLRGMPRTAKTRIAALTGYGQASDERRALSAGFDAHFVKPVETLKLLEFLQSET